jgi:hypothetical protein
MQILLGLMIRPHTFGQTRYTNRYDKEPMEVDHFQGMQCYKCREKAIRQIDALIIKPQSHENVAVLRQLIQRPQIYNVGVATSSVT